MMYVFSLTPTLIEREGYAAFVFINILIHSHDPQQVSLLSKSTAEG